MERPIRENLEQSVEDLEQIADAESLRPQAAVTVAVEALEQDGYSRAEAVALLADHLQSDGEKYLIDLPPDRKLYTVAEIQSHKPFPIVGGPCSGESPEQVLQAARELKEQGAEMMRVSLRKPRSEKHKFQGAGDVVMPAIDWARQNLDLVTFAEVADVLELRSSRRCIDVVWVGARFNPRFLLDVAEDPRPVGLKLAPGSTPEANLDLLTYFEDRLDNVFIIERGIYTPRSPGEPYARYTLDTTGMMSMRTRIHERYGQHIPIWVDPSHAVGMREYVLPQAKAAAGLADGFLVEFHPEPTEALSDARQQLPTSEFRQFKKELEKAGRALN